MICTVNRNRIVFGAPHWNSDVAGRVYYAFDTRGDALFLGCLLGLIATGGGLDGWKPWAKRTLTVLALVSTGVMIWIIWSVSLAPRSLPLLWLPVSEVASALIIVYFVMQPQGWGTRLMGIPILVFFGNMSYTIYLIHWPIYVAISPYTVKWSYWIMDPVRFAIIFPLAIASWYLMERPLMNLRRKKLDPTKPIAEAVSPVSPAEELGRRPYPRHRHPLPPRCRFPRPSTRASGTRPTDSRGSVNHREESRSAYPVACASATRRRRVGIESDLVPVTASASVAE